MRMMRIMVLILKISHDGHGPAAELVVQQSANTMITMKMMKMMKMTKTSASAPVTTIGQITRRTLVTAPKDS